MASSESDADATPPSLESGSTLPTMRRFGTFFALIQWLQDATHHTLSGMSVILLLLLAMSVRVYFRDRRKPRRPRIIDPDVADQFRIIEDSKVLSEAEKRARIRRLLAMLEERSRKKRRPVIARLALRLLLSCLRRRRK